MAYNFNSYYPAYYPQQNAQPVNNGITWVQGEAGAKSYLVAPGSTVTLWDTESQTIYLKSADASGMPTMKVLDYTMREMPQTAHNGHMSDFATKDDIDILKQQIDSLRANFEELSARKEKK